MKKQTALEKLWSQLNPDMWVFDNDNIRAILTPENDEYNGYKLSIKIKMLHGTETKYYFALSPDQAKEIAFKHIEQHLKQKTNELNEVSDNFYGDILWLAMHS